MTPEQMPPGLGYFPDFVSVEEEAALLRDLERFDWDGIGRFKRRGRIVRRREIYFLHNYVRDKRTVSPGTPLPLFLEPIRTRCAHFVGIPQDAFQQVIVYRYRPGAGIDWHTDSTVAFGETICGISLGSECVMKSRHKELATWPLVLGPRGLLILQGRARWGYEHRIPPVPAERYSITFRMLKNKKHSR